MFCIIKYYSVSVCVYVCGLILDFSESEPIDLLLTYRMMI